MLSMMFNNDGKLASSAYLEGKPKTSTRKMDCCKMQPGHHPRHSWQGTSGCVGSGALLLLLPKCPMCIAVYLTLWTGAGVAMPVATYLASVGGGFVLRFGAVSGCSFAGGSESATGRVNRCEYSSSSSCKIHPNRTAIRSRSTRTSRRVLVVSHEKSVSRGRESV